MVKLAEVTKSHETRQEEIQADLVRNKKKADDLIKQYKQGLVEREDIERELAAIEMNNLMLLNVLNNVNLLLNSSKEKEEGVKEFARSVTTTVQMNEVANDLNSLGFKIEQVGRVSDKVEDVMDRINEVADAHKEAAERGTSVDSSSLLADAAAKAKARLDKLDDLDNLEMEAGLSQVKLNNNGKSRLLGPSSSSSGSRPPASAAVRSPPHQISGAMMMSDEMEESDEEDRHERKTKDPYAQMH